MLEKSFGLTFFLKTPRRRTDLRYIYLRISVDGISKETSTKRKWEVNRWNQKAERAIGSKEDARALNYFLDTLVSGIHQCKTELLNKGKTITTQRIMDFVQGNDRSRAKLVEEFKVHNNEMLVLVSKKEYALGTHVRFETTLAHVREFLRLKYNCDDIEFRELNFEFVKGFEFYLKTVKDCNNNTALKYVSNLKKIVLRAVAKEIIPSDPFKLFKGKKTKTNKKPLSKEELLLIEQKTFSSKRLEIVRDVFVFQCYTGLPYIDVFSLQKSDIKKGIDGGLWIMIERRKTGAEINVPLLAQALEIIEKYKDDPICIERGSVLPVRTNQKMNEYLKEIATLCGITSSLNTHKARRTFASTVTLNNGVPIHVVKEMLGHESVRQTEEYALTEQLVIGAEMNILRRKLTSSESSQQNAEISTFKRIEKELQLLKNGSISQQKLAYLEKEIHQLKNNIL